MAGSLFRLVPERGHLEPLGTPYLDLLPDWQ
jgi:hypothetical protein